MLFHVGQGFILMFPVLGVGAPKIRFFRTHKGAVTAPPSPSSAHLLRVVPSLINVSLMTFIRRTTPPTGKLGDLFF